VLAISTGAAEAIKLIVSSSEVSEDGGIRISAEPIDQRQAKIELAVAASPESDDAVVEREGANVFVEQNAAMVLEDKTLDASIEGDSVSFTIVEQNDWSQNGRPEDVDPRNIG
jgi:iron-sulfur cluster assembly protein